MQKKKPPPPQKKKENKLRNPKKIFGFDGVQNL